MVFGRLAPFLLITFGLTWGLAGVLAMFPEPVEALFGPLSMTNPLFILAVYAPGIAAVFLVLLDSGFSGLLRFMKRLLLWRAHVGWYLLIGLGVPLIMTGAAAIGGNLEAWVYPFSSAGVALAALATALLLGPIEEFGWRGLMLPLLQQRLAPFYAGLILGAVWGLWHVPAFLLSGTPQSGWDFLPYFVGLMSVAMIMTVIFNASSGSLLLAVLMHFQLNNPLWPDSQPLDSLFFLGLAILVVWLKRRQVFTEPGVAVVIPD